MIPFREEEHAIPRAISKGLLTGMAFLQRDRNIGEQTGLTVEDECKYIRENIKGCEALRQILIGLSNSLLNFAEVRKTGLMTQAEKALFTGSVEFQKRLTDAYELNCRRLEELEQSVPPRAPTPPENAIIEEAIDRAISECIRNRRRRVSDRTWRLHWWRVRNDFAGRCPCCKSDIVLTYFENGEQCSHGEIDHWIGRDANAFEETWMICRECNLMFEKHPGLRCDEKYLTLFRQYHLIGKLF